MDTCMFLIVNPFFPMEWTTLSIHGRLGFPPASMCFARMRQDCSKKERNVNAIIEVPAFSPQILVVGGQFKEVGI